MKKSAVFSPTLSTALRRLSRFKKLKVILIWAWIGWFIGHSHVCLYRKVNVTLKWKHYGCQTHVVYYIVSSSIVERKRFRQLTRLSRTSSASAIWTSANIGRCSVISLFQFTRNSFASCKPTLKLWLVRLNVCCFLIDRYWRVVDYFLLVESVIVSQGCKFDKNSFDLARSSFWLDGILMLTCFVGYVQWELY